MNKDVCSGLFLLAVAAGYGYASTGIRVSSLADDFGPSGLPLSLAAVLAVLAAALVGRGLYVGASAEAAKAGEGETDADPYAALPRALGLLAIGAGYVLVVGILGYVVSIALLIAAVAVYESVRPGAVLAATAIGGALFFYLLFVLLLGVPQPRGHLF